MSDLARIRKEKGLTQKRLGEMIGATDVTISRYENEDQRLGIPILRNLSKALGVSISEIVGEQPPSTGIEGYDLIPAYDVEASAGPGSFCADDGEPIYHLAFRTDWLNSISKTGMDNLRVLFACGDSMVPTLCTGDTLLIDVGKRNPRHAGIYVVRWGDVINVKRISVDEVRQKITVSSDNNLYSTYEADPDEISVLGRVIWIGRKV